MFDFSAQVAALREGRQSPQHPWSKVLEALFLGAACQFAARHRIEAECRDGALSRRIGPLSENTMGYALQRQDPAPVFALGCEVACTLALLQDLIDRLGRRFLDVLVADALSLQTPFVKALEALGLEWVINLKENQPELLAEAQQDLQLWHAQQVYWPVADRSIRVVKTVRVQKKNRVTVCRDQSSQKRRAKEAFTEQSTNFYASNLELGSIPPVFIHQLGRSRWRIDAEVFQTITTDCHLKKPSVHQDRSRALVVLTMIRVLAYTLTQVFYHRQVRSHYRGPPPSFCELARNLAYLFFSIRMDSS